MPAQTRNARVRSRRMSPRWPAAILLSLLLAPPARTSTLIRPGEEAPVFILSTLDPNTPYGSRVNLRDYLQGDSGRRAVLISFYALWCAPCQAELPFLSELARKYAGRGLQIFLVSIDDEPELPRLRERLHASGPLPFPVLVDTYKLVYRRFGINALPACFLVGQDGKVRYVTGGFSDAIRQILEAQVAELLP